MIELDHLTEAMRLCWRARAGGQWHKSEFRMMTEAYARRLVEHMNREFPDLEHWTELENRQ
jgi:hypothetical protein